MPETVTGKHAANLTDYPDRFLTCRALSHTWAPQNLPWVENATDGTGALVVYEKFVCMCCSMGKIDQRTPYGRFIRRSYHQEPGYRVGADVKVMKQDFAGERFKRLLGSTLELEQTA